MTKYLISFPARAMDHLSPDELQAASEDSHAVVREARAAGVWVFGGGIDDGIAPVLVAGDGTMTADPYPESAHLDGGYTVLELPDQAAAREWAAKIAAACRCAQEVRAFHFDPES